MGTGSPQRCQAPDEEHSRLGWPTTMQDLNHKHQLDHLNKKVAVLLHQEQHTVPPLSAAQCHTVINTFRRMQQARDSELLKILKPFTDSLDELIPCMREWQHLCHGSGLHQPHSALMFKLDTLSKTDMGLKPGYYSLEEDVLKAIEASNKILRALAVEKKHLGLSKPMTLLKRNVKEMMASIQGMLLSIIDAGKPVPGARFRPFDSLDAEKDRVVLRNGVPFYVDPQDDNFLILCPSKHPLLKAPGSEWNKWFKIPRSDDGMSHFTRLHIVTGPWQHLRHQFHEAQQIYHEALSARSLAFHGTFHSIEDEEKFLEYVQKLASRKNKSESQKEMDWDHVENLDWDMATYLKLLEHREVGHTPSQDAECEVEELGLWYYVHPGDKLANWLHPGYNNAVIITNERIDHPCEFKLFKELAVDFSKMRMTPEEANGALTPYLYEDSDIGADFQNEPWAINDIPLGLFGREGLYLDTRHNVMQIKGINFVRPEFQNLH